MKMKKILKMPLRRMQRRPSPAEALRAKATANAGSIRQRGLRGRGGAEHEVFARFPGCAGAARYRCRRRLRLQFDQSRTSRRRQECCQGRNRSRSCAGRRPAKALGAGQTSSKGGQGRTHTVQAGDTLSRLASLYKTTIEAIENENGITTYSMIRVGQVLKIPAAQARKRPSRRPIQSRAAAKHAFLADEIGPAQAASHLDCQNGHRQTAGRRRQNGHRQTAGRRRQNGHRQASNRRREDRHRQRRQLRPRRTLPSRPRSLMPRRTLQPRTISKGGSAAGPHGGRRLRRRQG